MTWRAVSARPYPSDEMVDSVHRATRLPKSKIIAWFKTKREEEKGMRGGGGGGQRAGDRRRDRGRGGNQGGDGDGGGDGFYGRQEPARRETKYERMDRREEGRSGGSGGGGGGGGRDGDFKGGSGRDGYGNATQESGRRDSTSGWNSGR